jgi:PIN domain nuclease of toxin-antitoxin system
MAALVADTHAVLWYIFSDPRLSAFAAGAMDAATAEGDPIYVPSICLVEATYLVEKGRVPPVALERLTSALHNPQAGFRSAPLDLDVAFHVRNIPRELVPDMPDRIISATALALKLPLVTRDGKIRAANIQTIW